MGIPTNNDVGEINLLVTATDPLGLQAEGVFFLSVGNINNPPMINHDLDQLAEWQKLNEDVANKISKAIHLREIVEINLLSNAVSDDSDGLFIDPDSQHENQYISFSLSKDNSSWSNEISNIAEVKENIILINQSKDIIGPQIILIKATDANGASTILELNLNIVNVNDPPTVIRDSATQVTDNQWAEHLSIV